MRRDVAAGLTAITLAVLCALLAPALHSARKSSPKRDCINNLRQIGAYMEMYSAKLGAYPGSGPAFWTDLRSTIAQGQDSLFTCKEYGSHPGPGVVDYRGPALGVVLRAATPPKTPIAADCTNNHWNEINVLYFDGSVATVTPGSCAWTAALAATVVSPGRSESPPHPPELRFMGFLLKGYLPFYSFQAGLLLAAFGAVCWVAIRVAGRKVWT